MTEPVRWRAELARDDVPHLARRLEWALHHQNHRFAQSIPTSRIPVRTRQVLVIAAALVGFGAVFALRALGGITPGWFAAAIAIYSVGLGLGVVLPQFRARSRRLAGRMIARRAARTLAPLYRLVPATFEYALHDGRIAVACERIPRLPPCDPRAYRLVIAVGPSLFLFRRVRGFRPARTLHVPDDATRAAVLAAFLHAEHVALTGPLPGYDDAIPKATIASA